ncbi:MAG: lipocalin-like domain-containing protein [Sideroxydans sp.]|nr:lipocalin-like domain-containing protein [Sideroxydans sp.]
MEQEKQKNTVDSPIQLPRDQYAHDAAPTEWWWHIGTLTGIDGRQFGFEVNACAVRAGGAVELAFTEIAVTDVKAQKHYQIVNDLMGATVPADWAESDTSKPWHVSLPGSAGTADGCVEMTSIGGNPLHMNVTAQFTDAASGVACALQLNLLQRGNPLLVWGTGCKEIDPKQPDPYQKNNYYYSLTHLQASGTLTIGTEIIPVSGITWMDHEYGAFPQGSGPSKQNAWTLQDMQLDNGLHLSNYTQFETIPEENIPIPSNATLLLQNGESVFVDTVTTPLGPTYTTPGGIVYFLKFKIDMSIAPHATISFRVNSLCPDQVFVDPLKLNSGYEGVADAQMFVIYQFGARDTRELLVSSGDAWIEQSIPPASKTRIAG